MKKKLMIIGGGASGMTAAIVAAQKGKNQLDIYLLEKNEILGKKLLATGNGRCNFTNVDGGFDDFLQQRGEGTVSFQQQALRLFPSKKTLRFFAGLGVLARIEEEGRVYPYSGQGAVIQQALTAKVRELGIHVCHGCTVKGLTKTEDGFRVEMEQSGKMADGKTNPWKTMTADAVILSVGGKAGLQYGTVGEGYALAASLGHHIVKPIPALVPIRCEGTCFPQVKGVRAKGKVTLLFQGKPIDWDQGEIQFTEDGLSGICVFHLSRYVQWKDGVFPKGYEVKIDFSPELSEDDIVSLLEVGKSLLLHKPVHEFLKGLLHEKLAMALLERLGMEGDRKMGTFSDEQLRTMGLLVKDFRLPVVGTRSWRDAQVTCGGVALDEVHAKTMESKLVDNFYITGELLDVDGPCGGFNLQWAWCTGYIAGSAAAKNKEKND